MIYILPMLLLLSSNDDSYYFSLENRKTSERHLIFISEIKPVFRTPFCRAKLSSGPDGKNGNSSAELGVVFTRELEETCEIALGNRDYFLINGCLDVVRTLELSWDVIKLDKKAREFPFDLVDSIRCVDFNRNIILNSKFGTGLDIEVDQNFEKILSVKIIDGIADPTFDWQRKKITRKQAFDFMAEKYELQGANRSRRENSPW